MISIVRGVPTTLYVHMIVWYLYKNVMHLHRWRWRHGIIATWTPTNAFPALRNYAYSDGIHANFFYHTAIFPMRSDINQRTPLARLTHRNSLFSRLGFLAALAVDAAAKLGGCALSMVARESKFCGAAASVGSRSRRWLLGTPTSCAIFSFLNVAFDFGCGGDPSPASLPVAAGLGPVWPASRVE